MLGIGDMLGLDSAVDVGRMKIYLLTRDIPGIGEVVKVGYTANDPKYRARQYAGGYWDIHRVYPLAFSYKPDVREYEKRIHKKLKRFRNKTLRALGHTEIFTCTPEKAEKVIHKILKNKIDRAYRPQRHTYRRDSGWANLLVGLVTLGIVALIFFGAYQLTIFLEIDKGWTLPIILGGAFSCGMLFDR